MYYNELIILYFIKFIWGLMISISMAIFLFGGGGWNLLVCIYIHDVHVACINSYFVDEN